MGQKAEVCKDKKILQGWNIQTKLPSAGNKHGQCVAGHMGVRFPIA